MEMCFDDATEPVRRAGAPRRLTARHRQSAALRELGNAQAGPGAVVAADARLTGRVGGRRTAVCARLVPWWRTRRHRPSLLGGLARWTVRRWRRHGRGHLLPGRPGHWCERAGRRW